MSWATETISLHEKIGIVLRRNSRELVAKAILASAKEPRTEGLSIEVMDGSGSLEAELSKVVEGRVDAWTG